MTLTAMDVPVIDLAGTRDRDGARVRAALAIDEALSTVGVLSVVHHGVHPRTMARAFDAARTFFDQPVERKERVAAGRGELPGYGRPGDESPTSADGIEALPDQPETFRVHPERDRRAGPNRWPDDLVGFREAFCAYLDAASTLSAHLMELCALALGLERGWFGPHLDRASLTLRADHYPALDHRPGPRRPRGGAHTDDGSITLLATDGRPGLEVRDHAGEWHPVSAPKGAFVVNVGGVVSHWTNDRWRSTLHRVVPPADEPPNQRRLSLVLLQTPDDPARDGTVTAGRSRRGRT